MENARDIMVGIMGASSAFAGLVLVFSGFIFGQVMHARTKTIALIPFWGFLLTTLLALIWLIHPLWGIYYTSIAGFIGLVIFTGVYGTKALRLLGRK